MPSRPVSGDPWRSHEAVDAPGITHGVSAWQRAFRVEPWRPSFQEIYEFRTGRQPDVADDRVLATVLFTDIVDSTRRAPDMGDRDWRALLDAHDAVIRTSSRAFPANGAYSPSTLHKTFIGRQNGGGSSSLPPGGARPK
jgi:hypothetical protein